MRTIRILSLDGGGIRGIFSAQFMELFCQQAGIANVWEAFDLIVGTSIGGISALGYVNGMNPSDVLSLLRTQGPEIFTGYFGLGPASEDALRDVLALPGYNPVLYPNTTLESVLQSESVLGGAQMFQAKTNVLVTSFGYLGGTAGADDSNPIVPPATGDYSNTYFPYGGTTTEPAMTSAAPVNFSNVKLPFTTGQNNLMVDIGLATSAAPVYFPPVQLSSANNPTKDAWYIDGGLYQNNPTALGYTMAKVMFPAAQRISILSVGTGITNVGFDFPIASSSFLSGNVKMLPASSLPFLANVLAMTIAGAQDAVHEQFKYLSLYNALQEQLFYYRFQTIFPKDFPAELDNVAPGFDTNLINAANRQYNLDQQKILAFIQNSNFN